MTARRGAWCLLLALGGAGCLAQPGENLDLNGGGRDGGTRDARGVRSTEHRDVGLYASLDAMEPPDTGDPDGGLPYYNWIEHVQPIVIAKCQRCHGAMVAEGAPYPLMTYAQTQATSPAYSVPVHQRMSIRAQDQNAPMPPRMPPHPIPPAPDPLTLQEIEILRVWSLIGAPEGPLPDAGLPDLGVDAGDGDGGPPPDSGVDDTGVPPDTGIAPDTGIPPDTGIVMNDAGGPDPLIGIGQVTAITTPALNLAEGPAWHVGEQRLYFSDVSASTIYTMTPPANTVAVFRQPSGRANGLGFDNNGALVACEHETRRVSRTQANGMVIPLSAEYGPLMAHLNSPNDLAVRSDFIVYFTDPPYGLADPMTQSEQGVSGLYRRSLLGGLTTREYEFALTTEAPNGLTFSPDESILYVSDTMNGTVYSFGVDATGDLDATPTALITTQLIGPDGLCSDDDGNIYVAMANAISVHRPNGTRWGTIPVTGAVTNCTFGGPNMTTLYITTRNGLLFVEMSIPGGP